MAVDAIEELWQGLLPSVSQGSTICCTLVAVAQVGGGSSVPTLFCAKDQANENYVYRSGI